MRIKAINIFVKGFPKELDEKGLKEIFSKYGEVSSSKIIYDRKTKESRCFGFVKMPDSDEADKAIEALHDTEMDGNKLIVCLATQNQKPSKEEPVKE